MFLVERNGSLTKEKVVMWIE